jgi:ribosomal protein S5
MEVGVGVAKADDVVNAFKKAKTDGRKNIIKLPLLKHLFHMMLWRLWCL